MDYLPDPFNTSQDRQGLVESVFSENNISTPTSTEILISDPTGEIPRSFKEMSDLSRNCVVAYGILFLMAGTGNISVLLSVVRKLRHYRSRISLLILNLSMADLLVTFFVMPLEMVWRITIQWYGGDVLCKACQFMRAFGLYLSSMVVICVSLDRYFAIIYPMKLAGAEKRVKTTLVCAWISAVFFAAPQAVMFKVMPHPTYPTFHQCVTETFLRSDVEQELVYNVCSVSVLYFIPLVVIIFTYLRIIFKIHQKSKKPPAIGEQISVSFASRKELSIDNDDESMKTEVAKESEGQEDLNPDLLGHGGAKRRKGGMKLFLRRSTGGGLIMARARMRTLKLTCVILTTFVFCWTPYVVMTLWYMVDRDGAKLVDGRIQEGLLIMAVSNSVVNPLIYGTYGGDCSRASGNKYKSGPYYNSRRKGAENPGGVHHHGYTNDRRSTIGTNSVVISQFCPSQASACQV